MSEYGRLLVVDDEELYRELLLSRLERRGYQVAQAADGASALSFAESNDIDVALVDIKMKGMDGIEVLKRLKALNGLTEVIILTGFSNVDTAITAMKAGAYDYLSKPYKLSELELVVKRALEKSRLAQRCVGLKAEVTQLRDRSEADMIGTSDAWRATLELVRKAAPLDVPVLITGESGVGKEMVAKALHNWSARASESLVPLNCGALPENILESELFGYKKGAFTGAVADKEGFFHVATNGTLFLDEIGELPTASQPKLLRVLETGEYRPLGSTRLRRTNARLVAATNRKLESEVSKGSFREDLFYRLNVFEIHVPPLRDRAEDIPVLAAHFLVQSSFIGHQNLQFSNRAMQRLVEYAWPGNIRELKNVIERVRILCDGDCIEEDLVTSVLRPKAQVAAIGDGDFHQMLPLADLERNYVQWMVERCDGNVSQAARRLSVSRATVYRIIKPGSGD